MPKQDAEVVEVSLLISDDAMTKAVLSVLPESLRVNLPRNVKVEAMGRGQYTNQWLVRIGAKESHEYWS